MFGQVPQGLLQPVFTVCKDGDSTAGPGPSPSASPTSPWVIFLRIFFAAAYTSCYSSVDEPSMPQQVMRAGNASQTSLLYRGTNVCPICTWSILRSIGEGTHSPFPPSCKLRTQMAYVRNNAAQRSGKAKHAMHTEVDTGTQRNIIIPFQFEEQSFGNSSLSQQNSELYFIAAHIYCDRIQVFPQHTSSKLHLQSY